MANVPSHPSSGAEYFKANAALANAQAKQAQTQAEKALTERDLLAQTQGLGSITPRNQLAENTMMNNLGVNGIPTMRESLVKESEPQAIAERFAKGLLSGEVSPEETVSILGESLGSAAIQMASSVQRPKGLGSI